MNQFHLTRRALTLAYSVLPGGNMTAQDRDNIRHDDGAAKLKNLERVHHETIPADKRESSASEYRPAGASRETRPRPAPIHCDGGEGRKVESGKQKVEIRRETGDGEKQKVESRKQKCGGGRNKKRTNVTSCLTQDGPFSLMGSMNNNSDITLNRPTGPSLP